MTWILAISVIVLGLLAFAQHHRIGTLEFRLAALDIRVEFCASTEYHELQRKIGGSIQEMHEAVLHARSVGRLDLANKMMELQHFADSGYEAHWLDGMFRGLP